MSAVSSPAESGRQMVSDAFLVENHAPRDSAISSYMFLPVMALRHTSIVFLIKELAVWFRVGQGSSGMAHCPTHPTPSSYSVAGFQAC